MPDYKKNYKQNKGNQYKHNAEFAEEVLETQHVRAAQNNPRDRRDNK